MWSSRFRASIEASRRAGSDAAYRAGELSAKFVGASIEVDAVVAICLQSDILECGSSFWRVKQFIDVVRDFR